MIPVVVGSRSPRRLDLLGTILPKDCLVVCPPDNPDEPGFDDVTTLSGFESRLLEIVAAKHDDVVSRLFDPTSTVPDAIADEFVVICADTTVIIEDSTGRRRALGQPPDTADWQSCVAEWFRRDLAGRTHLVMTAVSIARCRRSSRSTAVRRRVCSTQVTMRHDVDAWLDWYLSTGESVGKAGGYAIQGAGSVFVTRVEGSCSNVVGLPLEAVIECFRELNLLEPA